MLVLEILRGTSAKPTYELGAPVITLGRAATNTIVLTDYHLSGEHAQILREGSGYVFRDLRSTNGSAVEVFVRDTGPGLGAGDPQAIFEPFYTTKPGGLGMGLAICRTIVELHGGTLAASSGSGGATFHFTLPVTSA